MPFIITMKNTLILFGRSLFINEIKDYIPLLINKYDTMGINSFYKSYPDVKYVIYHDKGAYPTEQISNTIVTGVKNREEVVNQKNVELYKVIDGKKEFSTEKGILYCYRFTSSMAINWAYLKGYKNVVLAGIDLINNLHFDNENFKPHIDSNIQLETKRYMEDVCQKYIKLFQLNPQSDLKIEKITIKKLIKEIL